MATLAAKISSTAVAEAVEPTLMQVKAAHAAAEKMQRARLLEDDKKGLKFQSMPVRRAAQAAENKQVLHSKLDAARGEVRRIRGRLRYLDHYLMTTDDSSLLFNRAGEEEDEYKRMLPAARSRVATLEKALRGPDIALPVDTDKVLALTLRCAKTFGPAFGRSARRDAERYIAKEGAKGNLLSRAEADEVRALAERCARPSAVAGKIGGWGQKRTRRRRWRKRTRRGRRARKRRRSRRRKRHRPRRDSRVRCRRRR
jgi:hypothetical protein